MERSVENREDHAVTYAAWLIGALLLLNAGAIQILFQPELISSKMVMKFALGAFGFGTICALFAGFASWVNLFYGDTRCVSMHKSMCLAICAAALSFLSLIVGGIITFCVIDKP